MKFKTAYAQKVIDESNNSWVVYSATGEVLAILPQPCDQHTAMAAIHMARDAEGNSFAEGVEFGKQGMLAANSMKLRQLQREVSSLVVMNDTLSEQLDRHLDR